MRWAWAAAVLALAPAHAAERASSLVSWKRALCLYTGCFLEPLVPDLRYEWGRREGAVLSWPLHPRAFQTGRRWVAVASPFLEPQRSLAVPAWRLLGGARLSVFPARHRYGAFVEGAGHLAEDGHGGSAGGGLSYDFIERHEATQPWTLSLVYRRTWTARDGRQDVALDITIPLAMLRGEVLTD